MGTRGEGTGRALNREKERRVKKWSIALRVPAYIVSKAAKVLSWGHLSSCKCGARSLLISPFSLISISLNVAMQTFLVALCLSN